MYCRECGKTIAEGAGFCTACGTPVSKGKPEKTPNKWLLPVLLGLAALVLLVVVALLCLLLLKPAGPGGPATPTGLQEGPRATAGVETEATEETLGMETISQEGLSQSNPYRECYDTYPDFVLPKSDRMYYSREDICRLSPEARKVAQQEIYARHGESAADGELNAYFQARAWYTPGRTDYTLNAYEKLNLKLLDVYQREQDGSLRRSENPYIKYGLGPDAYMVQDSQDRHLDSVDLSGREKDELVAIRNELFARHGYIFSDEHLLEFFLTKNWYQPVSPGSEFDRSIMSKVEQANVEFVRIYERIAEGVSFSSGNPYRYYYHGGEYILPYSSLQDVDYTDLDGLSLEQLCLARNEILARYGYTFSDEYLLEWFLQFSWYRPNTPIGDDSSIQLIGVEKKNIETIRAYEKMLEDAPSISSLDTRLTKTVKAGSFRVLVPAYWDKYAVCDTTGNTICFREKASWEAGVGGHVFTIAQADFLGENLYSPNDDTDYGPFSGYDYLGTLTKEGEDPVHLIVYWPTDVQFINSRMELYGKMNGEQGRILAEIEGINGWSFTPA